MSTLKALRSEETYLSGLHLSSPYLFHYGVSSRSTYLTKILQKTVVKSLSGKMPQNNKL